MLLRSSISNTKKFFQKTLKNFKSLFSSQGYQRLPKTSLQDHLSYSMDMNNHNTNYEDLYSNLNDYSELEKEKARRRMKKKMTLSSPMMQENNEVYNGSYISLSNASPNRVEKKEEFEKRNNKKSLNFQRGIMMKDSSQRRQCILEEKLRELEMLDMSNVEYVLDIEEVLHYYSRLTCPAYLEIVERFFMEMYSELFVPSWPTTPRSANSRLKMRYH